MQQNAHWERETTMSLVWVSSWQVLQKYHLSLLHKSQDPCFVSQDTTCTCFYRGQGSINKWIQKVTTPLYRISVSHWLKAILNYSGWNRSQRLFSCFCIWQLHNVKKIKAFHLITSFTSLFLQITYILAHTLNIHDQQFYLYLQSLHLLPPGFSITGLEWFLIQVY